MGKAFWLVAILAGLGLVLAGDGRLIVGYRASTEEVERDGEPAYVDVLRYQTELRAYPGVTIDANAYEAATKYVATYPYSTPPGAPQWRYIGPYNNPGPGGQYNGPGPVSGRVNAICIENNQSNSYVYVATPDGGIFEGSYDGSRLLGGKQWRPICDVASWPSLQTSAVAISPINTNELLAGTGDFQGQSALGCNGIMQGSYDGEADTWSWVPVIGAFSHRAISKILYLPDDPTIVYATTGRGAAPAAGEKVGSVFISRITTNGVHVFTPIDTLDARNLNWTDIVVGALDPKTGLRYIYACGYRRWDGAVGPYEIWRTTTRYNDAWVQVATGLEADPGVVSVDVACSPTDSKRAYAYVGAQYTNPDGSINHVSKIYRTTNAGGNWAKVVDTSGAAAGFPATSSNISQEWYDWYLACGSRTQGGNPVDVPFCGLITISASSDGGTNWGDIGFTYAATGGSYLTHNDQHCICFRPGSYSEGLCGNDGGIYRFTYNSANAPPAAYSPALNRDLTNAEYYHADWDAQNAKPDNILAGAQDNGEARTQNNTTPPVWLQSLAFGDGSGATISKANSNYRYASGYKSGLSMAFKNTANGTWQLNGNDDHPLTFAAGQSAAFFPPILADDRAAQYAMAASDHFYFFNSTTGAWAQRGTPALAGAGNYVVTIAKDPADAQTVLTGSLDGRLWYNTKGGMDPAWVRIDLGLLGWLPNLPISGIAVNPNNHKQVFVTMMGSGNLPRVYRCDDVTSSVILRKWVSIAGGGLPAGIPVNCIELDPADPANKIYVGTDIGCFYTNNGGAAWNNANIPLGLPNVRVSQLKVIGAGVNKTLNLASYGRGIWRISLPLP
ncbi:MAG TPA: hypothetical protein VHE55_12375 [Fimbriimonadaceae bacterium]|nr:hypothetical protein [Fimbriimonadaceae bacterium]